MSVSVSGSGGDAAVVRVERVVAGVVRSGGVRGIGCRAGRVITVQIIYEAIEKKEKERTSITTKC